MAGTIEVGTRELSSAASWLFNWVLQTLADQVGDPQLSADLMEVVAENLGWFSVLDHTTAQRLEIAVCARKLVAQDEDAFEPPFEGRQEAIKHLELLANQLE